MKHFVSKKDENYTGILAELDGQRECSIDWGGQSLIGVIMKEAMVKGVNDISGDCL